MTSTHQFQPWLARRRFWKSVGLLVLVVVAISWIGGCDWFKKKVDVAGPTAPGVEKDYLVNIESDKDIDVGGIAFTCETSALDVDATRKSVESWGRFFYSDPVDNTTTILILRSNSLKTEKYLVTVHVTDENGIGKLEIVQACDSSNEKIESPGFELVIQ